ncbi:MAG: nucleotide sugar dehydrogenase [Candidatus Promineifilaceae bacterium]|nr:nucleotide sugar dehydrogenase [Candidatus Promineifilaceae bacterium]
MSRKESLLTAIDERSISIGVVGLGYVGLPLAVAFAEAGFTVVGVDVDANKIRTLKQGQSYIEDVPASRLAPLVSQEKLRPTTDYGNLQVAKAISICVPTPLRKTGDPDISYIIHAADQIAELEGDGRLIVLESTTYPGTTEEIIAPRLVNNGEIIGKGVFVAFSPERIDPGRTDFDIRTTPKVIGGMTSACQEVALALYGTIVEQPVAVSNTATAEMVKLLENTFRAVNIGLVNEVALMCDRLGIDTWEVVRAAATKPYGFMPFYPGPGLGGHCIPIDPLYLSWKLRTLNYTARFIELAAEINSHMPEHVIAKIVDALNDEAKAVRDSRILVLGVAYKPNVSDTRESPALDIIALLEQKGALVDYHDPHVPDLLAEGIEKHSVNLTESVLAEADCVVIVAHHSSYDWSTIADTAQLIVDTRHAIDKPGRGRLVYL